MVMEIQFLGMRWWGGVTARGLYDPALGTNEYHVKCPTCFRNFDVAERGGLNSRTAPDISATSS